MSAYGVKDLLMGVYPLRASTMAWKSAVEMHPALGGRASKNWGRQTGLLAMNRQQSARKD